MKIWLDDKRCPPDNTWKWVTTPERCIDFLDRYDVVEISLDHDLGLPEPRNGYQVLKWLEAQAAFKYWRKVPDVIKIHTRNESAKPRMLAAVESINRYMESI